MAAWLDQHGGVVAVIGLVVAAGVAWYVYRDGVRGQREGILAALDQELEMHRHWVDHEYPGAAERWWEESDARLLSTVIYKLSIVAVDAAIVNGPSLFLNRRLLPALVGYRQTAGQFNQLVDQLLALEAAPELWRRFPSRHLVRRLRGLARVVHDGTIGHTGSGGAYDGFQDVTAALEQERRMRARAAIWRITGLRFRGG